MSESQLSDKVCVICRVTLDVNMPHTWSQVGPSIDNLKHFSDLRNDHELSNYIVASPTAVRVHNSCRKSYTSKRRFEQEQRSSAAECLDSTDCPPKTLRSSVAVPFEWKTHCMLCGMLLKVDTKHPERSSVSDVETFEIRKTITDCCEQRNDEWALQVLGRLQNCCDLIAVEARYHQSCLPAFYNGRSCPNSSNVASNTGRPVCVQKLETFELLCSWIELCDDELYTLDDLHDKMLIIAHGDEESVYSKKHLELKLYEKYGDHIFLAKVAGKRNVICFRNMASCVINDKWYSDRRGEIADESTRIVVAAAKLVKAQIRELERNMDTYPLTSQFDNLDIARHWVPPLLKTFMENIVSDDRKQVSLCHCIVQAARPRSIIAPIPFGLGVSLDHVFGSEYLLTQLSRLGYCVSYDEVNRYKQSVLQADVDELPTEYPQCFTQFAGDNVDHDVCTIDGKGSFHGMGVISVSIPCSVESSGKFSEYPITRCKRINVEHIVANRGIPIVHYDNPDKSSLSNVHRGISILPW